MRCNDWRRAAESEIGWDLWPLPVSVPFFVPVAASMICESESERERERDREIESSHDLYCKDSA